MYTCKEQIASGKPVKPLTEDERLVKIQYDNSGGGSGGGGDFPDPASVPDGKVLTTDSGAAVWGDAPSGLPEIEASDEGKVLTVVPEKETVTLVPEQTLACEKEAGQEYWIADLQNITKVPENFNDDDTANAIILIGEERTEISLVYNSQDQGFLNDEMQIYLAYDSDLHAWYLTTAEDASGASLTVVAEEETGDLKAAWESNIAVITVTGEIDTDNNLVNLSHSYNQILSAVTANVPIRMIISLGNGKIELAFVNYKTGNITFQTTSFLQTIGSTNLRIGVTKAIISEGANMLSMNEYTVATVQP